jgi:hypothetical protein
MECMETKTRTALQVCMHADRSAFLPTIAGERSAEKVPYAPLRSRLVVVDNLTWTSTAPRLSLPVPLYVYPSHTNKQYTTVSNLVWSRRIRDNVNRGTYGTLGLGGDDREAPEKPSRVHFLASKRREGFRRLLRCFQCFLRDAKSTVHLKIRKRVFCLKLPGALVPTVFEPGTNNVNTSSGSDG